MTKIEFRFPLAAVLLASALTVLGIPATRAIVTAGDVRTRSGSSGRH